MNVPHGWKLVPVEPTPAMTAAYAVAAEELVKRHLLSGSYPATWQPTEAGYAAMLAAAPTPPVQHCEPVGWLDGPHGEFRHNLAFRVTGPGSVAWSLPVFLAPPAQQDDEALEVLRELMLWIENWGCAFHDDPEWPETDAKVRALLTKRGAA